MSEWTRFEDKRPPRETPLLTFGADGIHVGTYRSHDGGTYWHYAVSDFDLDGVTHWMLLPNPPSLPGSRMTPKEALQKAIVIIEASEGFRRIIDGEPNGYFKDRDTGKPLLPRLRAALESEE